MGAIGIHNRRFGSHHGMAAEGLDAGYREGGGKGIAGHNRTTVGEALVTVHNTGEVDTGIWFREQLSQGGFLNDNGKRGWGNDIGMARRAGRAGIVIDRVGRKHGTREFAHFFTTDKIWCDRRKDTPLQLRVY